MSWLRLPACLLLAVAVFAVQAQVTVEKPAIALTVEQEARLAELLPDLRCLVCQNESLAESRAPLALDLKYEVRSLVAQGKTSAEIKAYLTARYGDFVLFKPPFDARTWLLWLGPFGLVLVALLVLLRQIRSTRRAAATAAATAKPADAAALKKLLDE